MRSETGSSVDHRLSVDEAPLLGLMVSAEHRRVMTVLVRIVVTITLLTAFVAQRQFIAVPGYYGPCSNTMMVASALTAFFLLCEARRSASVSLVALAFAFAANSWFTIGQFFVFPGNIFVRVEPWQTSAASWMTFFRHACFLAGVIGYRVLEARRVPGSADPRDVFCRSTYAWLIVIANVALAFCAGTAALAAALALPSLYRAAEPTLLGRCLFGALFASEIAFLGFMWLAQRRTKPHLLDAWLFVVMLAAACDLCLWGLGTGRYSMGWYVSRLDGLIANASILVALCYQVVHLRESAAIARRQAHYDFLTGLPNRALLSRRIADALVTARAQGTFVALLFCDLDRFKSVNDTLGHEAGDQILRVTGSRLAAGVGGDDTVARLGGDEFIVLLANLYSADAFRSVVTNLRTEIMKPTTVCGIEIDVGASIGVSVFPSDAHDEKSLLRCGDAALYEAKRAGRNRVVRYERSMNHVVTDRGRLAAEIRAAIGHGEFVLHYQPIVRASTLELIGAEALVRWQSPEHGLVAPATFLKAAEDSGEIVAMGGALLEHACRQLARWQQVFGCSFSVSINLSPRQFVHRDLFGLLRRTLERYELAPQTLELELTESSLFSDLPYAEAALRECRDFGVRVAIDDFGTGYNSLTYLRRLPLTTLKIDRSFVADIGVDRHGEAIVSALLTLSQTIGLRVIAEGVESFGQLAHLRDLGCDCVQGYLVSRPLSPADFEARYVNVPASAFAVR